MWEHYCQLLSAASAGPECRGQGWGWVARGAWSDSCTVPDFRDGSQRLSLADSSSSTTPSSLQGSVCVWQAEELCWHHCHKLSSACLLVSLAGEGRWLVLDLTCSLCCFPPQPALVMCFGFLLAVSLEQSLQ